MKLFELCTSERDGTNIKLQDQLIVYTKKADIKSANFQLQDKHKAFWYYGYENDLMMQSFYQDLPEEDEKWNASCYCYVIGILLWIEVCKQLMLEEDHETV